MQQSTSSCTKLIFKREKRRIHAACKIKTEHVKEEKITPSLFRGGRVFTHCGVFLGLGLKFWGFYFKLTVFCEL